MIMDAYKVAVHLSIVDKVSPVLAAFSSRLQKSGQDVTALENKLNRLGRVAAAGGVLAGLGVGILAGAERLGQAAAEYETIWARLRQMGLGDGQIADARKWATANDIIGTSLKDRARLFAEAQGAFRESGMAGDKATEAAKTMTPVLANYITARKVLGQDTSHEDELQLNKIVELMGGLNNTKRAQEVADAVFKASQSSGGMVSVRDLRQFMTQGGTSVAALGDKTIFAGLEPIIGEFGGSVTGTGMQTAFNRTHGILSRPPKIMTNEMLRLGLWDPSKLEFNSQGGIKSMKGNPMVPGLAGLQEHNTLDFAQKMLDIYKANSITTISDIARENEIIFGRTGGRIYTKIMQQLPVLLHSENAYDVSRGASQTVKDNTNSAQMQILRFNKALADLQLEIGQGVLPVLTPMIEKLASFVHTLTQYPTLLSTLTTGFITLGAAMAFSGTLMLLRAGFGGLGVAASALSGALPSLGVAAAAVLSPIGLVVAALGTLALAAYAFRPLSQSEIDAAKDQGGAKLTPSAKARIDAGELGSQRPVVTPNKQQAMQFHSQINLDGRKLGESVTGYLLDGMGRPQSTSSGFDFTRSAPPIGHSFAR